MARSAGDIVNGDHTYKGSFRMTRQVEGKFSRVFQGIGYLARVIMKVTTREGDNTVTVENAVVESSDYPFRRGAEAGTLYALKIAGKRGVEIEIKEIIASPVDTNMTLVSVAAILGVWQAIEFESSPELAAEIEQIALTSWQRHFDDSPYLSEFG